MLKGKKRDRSQVKGIERKITGKNDSYRKVVEKKIKDRNKNNGIQSKFKGKK